MRARRSSAAGRRSAASVVLLTILAAGAVAACGRSSSASPAPTPSSPATASPAVSPSAAPGTSDAPSTSAPLPPGAFSVDLPAGWRAVPTTGDDALLADLAKTNPAFAESLRSRLANLADTATYVAVDTSEKAVKAGNVVTLIVTEIELPVEVSLQTFTNTIQGQAQQLVEEPVSATKILVGSGEAYMLEYVAPIERADGTTGLVSITQVLFVVPGRGYVMTFSAPPSVAKDYGETFAAIATSFTLTP